MASLPTEMQLVQAATVICLREKPNGLRRINLRNLGLRQDALDSLDDGGGVNGIPEDPTDLWSDWVFEDNFEVLLGQNEVINWMRSRSEEDLSIMRYAGEFKLPGGSNNKYETLGETAVRELQEEFLIKNEKFIIRPFYTLMTKAVKGKQYLMHNFLCLEHENPWLKNLDKNTINHKLNTKREKFFLLKQEPNGWDKWKAATTSQKELLSPEVRSVKWFNLHDSVLNCLTSNSEQLTPVNEFQDSEFKRYNVLKRDPMYATLLVILRLTKYTSLEDLAKGAVATSRL